VNHPIANLVFSRLLRCQDYELSEWKCKLSRKVKIEEINHNNQVGDIFFFDNYFSHVCISMLSVKNNRVGLMWRIIVTKFSME
jgi:hypothetical protein